MLASVRVGFEMAPFYQHHFWVMYFLFTLMFQYSQSLYWAEAKHLLSSCVDS